MAVLFSSLAFFSVWALRSKVEIFLKNMLKKKMNFDILKRIFIYPFFFFLIIFIIVNNFK